MTFKELRKKVSNQQQQQQINFFDRLKNKPFWIWNIDQHKLQDIKTKGECCFNHIIGLPAKNGIEKPLYDYQELLYNALIGDNCDNNNTSDQSLHSNFKSKHLWVKKATGLGITEFFLRFMAWLCLKDESLLGSQMVIVTGPNIDIAIKLIKRMKALFQKYIIFDTKETVLELNGCHIEAYPSHHIDAFRALDSPKFILLDEADFFQIGQQADARHVSERYIAKSDPYIVIISTPNAPNGLFEAIEKEPEDVCFALEIDPSYTYALSNKGNALDNLGKFNEGIACHDRALEIDPNFVFAMVSKGVVFGLLGKYNEAIECSDKALEVEPKNALALNSKGSALYNLGKHKEAIEYYDKALEVDSKNALALNNKGNVLDRLGKYKEAIWYFDKALEVDSKNALAWSNKGITFGKLDKYNEALEYFDKALEIDPKDANAWYNKGSALYNLGKYQEAIECYDKALEIEPNDALALKNRDVAFNKLKDQSEQTKMKWYTSDGKPVYE